MSQLNFEFGAASSLEADFEIFSARCVAEFDAYFAADAKIARRLVGAYLWYRKLDADRRLLANLYKREGLDDKVFRATDKDFSQFVALAFRLGLRRTERDKLRHASMNSRTLYNKKSGYAAALVRLHNEYTANSQLYDNDAEEKLLAFHVHADQGGIEGARTWRAAKNAPASSKRVTSTAAAGNDDFVSAEVLARQWIEQNALTILSGAPAMSRTVLRPAHNDFDADGFGIAITRKGSGRRCGLISMANEGGLLTLAAKQASKPRYTQSRALRGLAEIIGTQRYPKQFAPPGSRLDPNSRYCRWERAVLQEKGNGGWAERHLLFRRGSIVFSPSRVSAGIVTAFKPCGEWGIGSTAFADTKIVRTIEHLVDEQAIAAFSTYPLDEFRAARTHSRSTHWLLLKCNAEQVKSRGMFLSDVSARTWLQPDLDLSAFTPRWSFAAEKRWFRHAQRAWFNEWFTRQVGGNRLKRPENRILRLSIGQRALTIGHEIDQTGTGPSRSVSLGVHGATEARVYGRAHEVDVSSKDFAPLFYSLPEIEITGRIDVSADDHLVLFQFETELGTFKVGVPAASVTRAGVARDDTHMQLV